MARDRSTVHHRALSVVWRVTASAVVCGVTLTGCASPGGGASTNNDVSRCAAVLPTARDLVHGQGRLVLVRPVKQTDIDTITRDASRPSAPAPSTASAAPSGTPHRPPGAHPPAARSVGTHPQGARPQSPHAGTPGRAPRLCLVVYQGSFRAAAITGAQPAGASGHYALVFLWVRHPSVDRTLITNAVPASAHRPWWHF